MPCKHTTMHHDTVSTMVEIVHNRGYIYSHRLSPLTCTVTLPSLYASSFKERSFDLKYNPMTNVVFFRHSD